MRQQWSDKFFMVKVFSPIRGVHCAICKNARKCPRHQMVIELHFHLSTKATLVFFNFVIFVFKMWDLLNERRVLLHGPTELTHVDCVVNGSFESLTEH